MWRKWLASVCAAVGAASFSMPAAGGNAVPTCRGERATIVGTDEDETIEGTPGNDVIAALQGHDDVRAGPGDDIVCGNGGRDHVAAGAGNDEVQGGRARDTLAGHTGNDVLILGQGPIDKVGPNRKYGGWIHAGPGNDLLRGNPATREVYEPHRGADRIIDGGGPRLFDELFFPDDIPNGVVVDLKQGFVRGEGRDQISGIDRVQGTDFNDIFRGNRYFNHFFASYGKDKVRGRGGDDRLSGFDGEDEMYGGKGDDFVAGGRDDDLVDGGDGRDWCTDGEPYRNCEKRGIED